MVCNNDAVSSRVSLFVHVEFVLPLHRRCSMRQRFGASVGYCMLHSNRLHETIIIAHRFRMDATRKNVFQNHFKPVKFNCLPAASAWFPLGTAMFPPTIRLVGGTSEPFLGMS